MTFNSNRTSAIVNITIIETSSTQYENDEEFIVNLSFPGEPISRVTLNPNRTIVQIVEFDGEGIHIIYIGHDHIFILVTLSHYDTVGFISSEYTASEGDDLEITVALLSGKLRDVIVLSLVCSPQTDGKHTNTHQVYTLHL
jgi:hypothetical protein